MNTEKILSRAKELMSHINSNDKEKYRFIIDRGACVFLRNYFWHDNNDMLLYGIKVIVDDAHIFTYDDRPIDLHKLSTLNESKVKSLDEVMQEVVHRTWIADQLNVKQNSTIDIKKVVFNEPATIVFWTDGTKTVVKDIDGCFDPEKGLAMAISKKYFGNKGNYYNKFKKWLPSEEEMELRSTLLDIVSSMYRMVDKHE